MRNYTWWQQCVMFVVMTGCVIAILLATANNPSADELWRGGLGAAVAALGVKLFDASQRTGGGGV